MNKEPFEKDMDRVLDFVIRMFLIVSLTGFTLVVIGALVKLSIEFILK